MSNNITSKASRSQLYSDAALDAGIAAWFGVTKVEAEKHFIRTRMLAAVHAVVTADDARPSAYVHSAGILPSDTPQVVVQKLDAAFARSLRIPAEGGAS